MILMELDNIIWICTLGNQDLIFLGIGLRTRVVKTKTQTPDSYKRVFMLHNDLFDAEPYDEFRRQNNW